jgi:sec-independent protein translocase protein TatB
MLDIGWSELLVIAIVALIVVGPKELPKLLRTMAQGMAAVRRMAGDFQGQFREAMREAELDGVRKTVEDLKSLNPASMIRETMESVTQPLSDAARSVSDDINRTSAIVTGAGVAAATTATVTGTSAAAAPSTPPADVAPPTGAMILPAIDPVERPHIETAAPPPPTVDGAAEPVPTARPTGSAA